MKLPKKKINIKHTTFQRVRDYFTKKEYRKSLPSDIEKRQEMIKEELYKYYEGKQRC